MHELLNFIYYSIGTVILIFICYVIGRLICTGFKWTEEDTREDNYDEEYSKWLQIECVATNEKQDNLKMKEIQLSHRESNLNYREDQLKEQEKKVKQDKEDAEKLWKACSKAINEESFKRDPYEHVSRKLRTEGGGLVIKPVSNPTPDYEYNGWFNNHPTPDKFIFHDSAKVLQDAKEQWFQATRTLDTHFTDQVFPYTSARMEIFDFGKTDTTEIIQPEEELKPTTSYSDYFAPPKQKTTESTHETTE